MPKANRLTEKERELRVLSKKLHKEVGAAFEKFLKLVKICNADMPEAFAHAFDVQANISAQLIAHVVDKKKHKSICDEVKDCTLHILEQMEVNDVKRK